MSGFVAGALPDLVGRTVLIAESNPLIALDLAATVDGWGGSVLLYHELAAPDRERVLQGVSAALINVTQDHEETIGLIEALQQHSVPIVLTTAWHEDRIADRFPGITVLEKPVSSAALAAWFATVQAPSQQLSEIRSSGSA